MSLNNLKNRKPTKTKMRSGVLPSGRKYSAFRHEEDTFIGRRIQTNVSVSSRHEKAGVSSGQYKTSGRFVGSPKVSETVAYRERHGKPTKERVLKLR